MLRYFFSSFISIKDPMKLFPAYTGEKKSKIVASPSFSRGPIFRQTILKTVSASSKTVSEAASLMQRS
jgi:hypothetical protein